MKNFTQNFIGLLALVFAMSFTVNSQAQNNINLPQGWSMFGYNCEEPQEVTTALNEIVDKIVIVKDHFGNAYLPELDFNGIGDFTNGVGYQIKMIEQVDGFQFCSSVLPDDGIGQADVDAVQTELAIALESLSDLTEQMEEIALSYNSEQLVYISEFVNSLLLDVSTLLDSDALDLNSLTELAENYLTPGIAYLTDNSLVTDEEVSLLYDILFDIAALVANQEDGITQVDVDAAYAEGAASVTPEDGIGQADVDAAVAEVEASYSGWLAPVYGCTGPDHCNYNSLANTDDGSCVYAQEGYDCDGNVLLQIGDQHAGGIVFQINEDGTGLVADLQDLGLMDWWVAMDVAESVTSQGYDDWYLPSIDELELMYSTIGYGGPEGNIGGFEYDWYWSSSESSSYLAWGVAFSDGTTGSTSKNYAWLVRIIRAF
jgi:hypothetical protein